MENATAKRKLRIGAQLAKVALLTLTNAILAVVVRSQENVAQSSLSAHANSTAEQRTLEGESCGLPAGTIMRVDLPDAIRISRLKPAASLEGNLARPLFCGRHIVVPAGTPTRFVVDSIEKEKSPRSARQKLISVIDRAFNPFRQKHPDNYVLQVRSAYLLLGEAPAFPLHVSFLRIGNLIPIDGGGPERHIRSLDKSLEEHTKSIAESPDAQPLSSSQHLPARQRSKKRSRQVLLLALEEESVLPANAAGESEAAAESEAGDGQQGFTARAYLLSSLSAAKNHQEDQFQASLAEPLRRGDSYFPAGTRIEGHIARRVPPRWLSRAGMLILKVDRILPQTGEPVKISGTLVNAEAETTSQFVMDEEGGLQGRKPGIGAALWDVGIGYALGKLADDVSEAPIRAIAAGVGDASVAATARYFGLGTASIFLLTRHGQDVNLSKFSEIEILFPRDPPSAGKTESNGSLINRPAGTSNP